jgi:hypothetical protein
MRRLLFCLLPIVSLRSQEFDASQPDRLRISTSSYELVLSKATGGIVGITDKSAHAAMPITSRSALGNAAYEWNQAKSLLRLVYPSAVVTIVFSPHSFDTQLTVENHTGATLESVAFPSDLVLQSASIRAAYIPYFLPGARVKTGFFTGHHSLVAVYPGTRAFIDYLALDYAGGRIAWYSVNPTGKIAPVQLGFRDDEKNQPGTCYALHNFQTWIRDGTAFSTPVVRFQIGEDPAATIADYRQANGIDKYPSLQEKLGDRMSTIAAAPLVKMGMRDMHRTLAESATYLGIIRAPAILHPVSYWPVGFDRDYPDFLPPDPTLGTTADFRTFVEAAHARGLMVMPYTNPTWWDDQSPTAKSVPDLSVFAVLTADGKPLIEHYGPNQGFVASPSAPAVQQRLAALMKQWRDDVPVDFVLQDQIGSRSWLRDFNPAAPDPQCYSDAWFEFTRKYAGQRLMTEDGWDRIAATETGFTGSLLTGTTAWNPQEVRWGEHSRGNAAFGAGNWEPYPLGDWLFHDKVLFYHHDLSHPPMDAGPEVLTWNAAFGVMAGYLWPELHLPYPDWPAIAAAFQPAILSRSAGKLLEEYREISDSVSAFRYGDLIVIANWNAGAPYIVQGYKVAPSGFIARTGDGSVMGGIFVDQFNGSELSAGLHYLLIERSGQTITIRQPSGADTPVAVTLPAEWDLSKGVNISPPGPLLFDGNRAIITVSSKVDRYQIKPN